MSAPYITAFDIAPGQTWRFEVTQAADRYNAVVREVTNDGHVRLGGEGEFVPIGSLLAYWRLVT